MSQPQPLFQPEDVPRACLAEGCGSVRLANQRGPIPGCAHERERALGGTWKRPRGCLNAHEPQHAPWPPGY